MPSTLTDTHALAGAREARVIWDINATDAKRLTRQMGVIARTYDDLLSAGATPHMVFAFRGPAVTFIAAGHPQFEALAERLRPLMAKPNVRMEICGIAAGNNGVDLATVLDGIEPVNNTFVSLIGWQQQGYTLIPIG
ncbi:DsrE family protein [uncultured Thiohalocapsa sp.]|uniref:DsrE family protein n=1 Tax=uncultured Thiohalocapsa sp. TaxID=768990 RepID=UPI0025CF47BA|nr:DsrE family protein [uncultured Thiohalocapsa sp.]